MNTITDEQVRSLTGWFDTYTTGILEAEGGDEHIQLKIDHTKRVCDEILMLGRSEGLEGGSLNLAYVVALFHDIGRFDQFAAYRTFVDKDSVDHAAYGVTVLTKEHILDGLGDEVRETIFTAIEHHNKAYLPAGSDEELLYLKLVRDADKLDIYKVVTDYYGRSEPSENKVIQLGLPDSEEISPAVIEDIEEKHIVLSAHLQNLNDFKLLQAAWVFDCNFTATYQAIRERGYLKLIASHLPKTEQVREIFQSLDAYLEERCD